MEARPPVSRRHEETVKRRIRRTVERRGEQSDGHQEELDFSGPVALRPAFDHHTPDETTPVGQEPAMQDVLQALADLLEFEKVAPLPIRRLKRSGQLLATEEKRRLPDDDQLAHIPQGERFLIQVQSVEFLSVPQQ